ncbi:MAG: hypothetical protein HY692_07655, partial [Cyanobacteria bacterium NC_groundwater_1444_Ag_S-0.65um_54_12]|nr:hypothetical protein [Cyanobacteria bacterium NC_groundwater_1444_Ag_S-0.65um_54_12]
MKWQSTAILAVLAIGIGSYIYFVERKAAAPPSDDRTIFIWNMSDNQAEPVNRVMLRAGDKKVTYVKQSPAPTPKPTGSNTPEPWATPPQPTWHLEGKLDRGLTYTWDSA